MKTSILLVEDNQTIGQNIQKYLELEGYSVLWVQNWSYANEVVKHQEFDLVLLDLMLPGTDGLVVAKTIKEHQEQTRILMMTAKGQLEDKLEGFEVWADDYLVKPFDLEELVARIEALLRRSVQKDVVSYGVLTLDNLQKKIFKSWEEIKLSLKEFQILELGGEMQDLRKMESLMCIFLQSGEKSEKKWLKRLRAMDTDWYQIKIVVNNYYFLI